MEDTESHIVANEEFTADDQSALAWAASTENPVAVAIVVRVRSGADANVTVGELAAIRQDWEADGRPPPKPHVHRTPVRFADGTTVMGVRFLGDDPYDRENVPGFGFYLDERWAPPWPHEHLAWTCGAYRLGHDVHFIQAKLSRDDGPGTAAAITSVAEDGTITCSDGTRLWNHDPTRLRTILAIHGNHVLLASTGVLGIPHGDGTYYISVTDRPDPCRPDTADSHPGESIVDELHRRGGFVRRIADLRADLEPE